MKKIISKLFPVLALVLLSGCAAGSATAGYALKADSANSLSADAEQRIVERAKKEAMSEMDAKIANK